MSENEWLVYCWEMKDEGWMKSMINHPTSIISMGKIQAGAPRDAYQGGEEGRGAVCLFNMQGEGV